MPDIDIRPASSDRFEDAEATMTGGGDGGSCQCQWWMMPNAEFQRMDGPAKLRRFRDEIEAGPPPGLIAYVDGEPAGWIRVGPRSAQQRIQRTRAIAATSVEPWDDDTVWAVSCFSVRREHRRQGLNRRLLDAAIAFARDRGARVLEAYPVDPDAGRKVSSNELYHGAVSTFARAGFVEVGRPRPDRAVMSLALD